MKRVSIRGPFFSFKKLYENAIETSIISLNEKYPGMIIKKGSPVAFKVIGKVADMINYKEGQSWITRASFR
jgi:SOS-response transcriptional repressor LexA